VFSPSPRKGLKNTHKDMEPKIEYITIDFMLFNKVFSGENIYQDQEVAIREAKLLKAEFEVAGLYPQISIVFSYEDGEITAWDLDLLTYMRNTN
jgi:hypothetical protein